MRGCGSEKGAENRGAVGAYLLKPEVLKGWESQPVDLAVFKVAGVKKTEAVTDSRLNPIACPATPPALPAVRYMQGGVGGVWCS